MPTLQYHGAGQVSIDGTAEPGGDGVVVELRYAGLNPLDVRLCRGAMDRGLRLPMVPGTEGVGEVGGRPVLVYGRGVGTARSGTFAERASVPEEALRPLPPGLDPVQAAAMATAGVTAWNLVNTQASVGSGDEVLVLGAGGGVGVILVQLVRATGARVLAQTASPQKADALRALGVEAIVVPAPGDLRPALDGTRPSLVFDGLGGDFTGAAIGAMKGGGTAYVYGASAGATGTVDLLALYRGSARVVGYASMREPGEHVDRAVADLVSGIESGGLVIPIHEVVPLHRFEAACRALEERRVFGKIVLDVRTDSSAQS